MCALTASGASAQTPPAARPAAPGAAPRALQLQARPAIDYNTAHLDRKITPVRLSGGIKLDGVLDEAAWRDAPMATGFIQNDPREGTPATYDTEVRVLYNDEALYFGVYAKDDSPNLIVTNDLKKDYNREGSDGFRVILDTFNDGRNGYQFMTNPGGAKWDAQMANEGRDNNANWDGIWDVKTRKTETGWYAEIWIPFRTLKFSSDESQVWGVNFQRKLRRLNEDSYWSPLPRIYDIERTSLAGQMNGMVGLRSGRNIRLKPWVLSSGTQIAAKSSTSDFQGGIDAKYGLTSGLVWDFTVNTDFAQVEADEQQINLTRFNLFFPEKRDFFLENQGIFTFGDNGGGGGGAFNGRTNQAQDVRLFFTRQIGLSETAQALPILAGTRLSGRQGAYSMGVLNIQQRADLGFAATNYTAFRFRRDVLTNSDIGMVFLDKEVAGPRFNRMIGADANFRFGFTQITGLMAKSVSPVTTRAGSGNDALGRIGVNYTSRQWRLNLRYQTIGTRFNDEMGFVPRVGVNEVQAQVYRSLRPRWLPRWIREVSPHWVLNQFNRADGNALDMRQMDFHFPISFSSGASTELGLNTNIENIAAPFTLNAARGARIPVGSHEYTESFIYYRPNQGARLQPSVRLSVGRFYNGYRRSWAFGPEYHPNEKLNASLTLQFNDVSLPTVSYLQTLTTARLNYNFNTKMFLNALLQYNTDTHQLSSNIRFNIIHRPLSDVFFVYNEHRDERLGFMQDRSFIGKVTYMMAF
jgi:hypothetical protein